MDKKSYKMHVTTVKTVRIWIESGTFEEVITFEPEEIERGGKNA